MPVFGISVSLRVLVHGLQVYNELFEKYIEVAALRHDLTAEVNLHFRLTRGGVTLRVFTNPPPLYTDEDTPSEEEVDV